MIKFEIGNYNVSAYLGDQPVRVYLRDADNKYRGYIDFLEEVGGAKFIVHPNGIINAAMPASKMHAMIDLLRNEKPMYLVINEEYGWGALQTGIEPVGEEETAAP